VAATTRKFGSPNHVNPSLEVTAYEAVVRLASEKPVCIRFLAVITITLQLFIAQQACN